MQVRKQNWRLDKQQTCRVYTIMIHILCGADLNCSLFTEPKNIESIRITDYRLQTRHCYLVE